MKNQIDDAPQSVLITSYAKWLKTQKHCAEDTIRLRQGYLSRFFEFTGGEWDTKRLGSLDHCKVETIFLAYGDGLGNAARRSMQATLRLFFRYCFLAGFTSQDLSKSIPTLRTYKLSTTPRGISDEDAHRVLQAVNRTTSTGRRDFAILCLLYHYGVRGRQVCNLQHCDVFWREDKIRFNALKHGKSVVMPLLMEVGEALLDYIKHSRSLTPSDRVFLTLGKPYRPLDSPGTISNMVALRLRKLNIDVPSKGAGAFRHCFATRMLQQGNSIKAIADCLGHRSIETTAIYSKVDFAALNNVALELPTQEDV